tara:strand:- start:300 stop:566 length:267 start_codon:yes stop_codon:yes gene_type:complete
MKIVKKSRVARNNKNKSKFQRRLNLVKKVKVMKAFVATLAMKVTKPQFRNPTKKKLVTGLMITMTTINKNSPNNKLSSSALSSKSNPL